MAERKRRLAIFHLKGICFRGSALGKGRGSWLRGVGRGLSTEDVRIGSIGEFHQFGSGDPTRTDMLNTIAPPRLVWRDRYQILLGPVARDVVDAEETERFRMFELITRRTEYDLLQFWTADRSNSNQVLERGRTACISAAALGWYVEEGSGPRISLAEVIFKQLTDPAISILAVPVRTAFESRTDNAGKIILETNYKAELTRRRDNSI